MFGMIFVVFDLLCKGNIKNHFFVGSDLKKCWNPIDIKSVLNAASSSVF